MTALLLALALTGQASTQGSLQEVFPYIYSESTDTWYNNKGQQVKIKPIPIEKLTKKHFANKHSIVPAPNKFKPYTWLATKDGLQLKIIVSSGYRFYSQRLIYKQPKLKDW